VSTARRRVDGDDGMTLMELMVGMGIMTIFMAIFTTAVVAMFSSTSKTQAVKNSSTELNTVFDRLDRQVRYASAIDQPIQTTISPTNVEWSVAFRTDDPTSTTSATCNELKIRQVAGGTSQQLVARNWTRTTNTDGTTSASNVSAWSQLAGGITLTDQTGATVQPFTRKQPTGDVTVQQLWLQLAAVDGNGKAKATSSSQIRFSALNSAGATAGRACTEPEEL
jgi:prepilin-type N-terminal cleavage/methylation domain-containing protein